MSGTGQVLLLLTVHSRSVVFCTKRLENTDVKACLQPLKDNFKFSKKPLLLLLVKIELKNHTNKRKNLTVAACLNFHQSIQSRIITELKILHFLS